MRLKSTSNSYISKWSRGVIVHACGFGASVGYCSVFVVLSGPGSSVDFFALVSHLLDLPCEALFFLPENVADIDMMKLTGFLFIALFIGSTAMEKMYTFSTATNARDWRIVNDGVMGGVSTSSLAITDAGHGRFSGHVSLANYGGFASVQLNTDIALPKDKKFIVLRVKGDGKNYEFRLKGDLLQAESYVHPFATSGEWETIRLEIGAFYPQFRGQRLTTPNFHFPTIQQWSFLIANKKEEDFELLIDWIGLE